ncbi:hypothetical protein [Fibrella forsythiae]|uniref:Coiled-coil protein n=1 Tax=Fibrella forsythiae TaxID=2817061 RepID=A0ABS3JB81_9BACT|nr:hypothetical protein [Fibrella forsythiae]MBO0947238.1 hypothetical protein [Fibrella forsythiae]
MDYFDKQNELLYQHLEELFSISKAHRWEDVSKNITLWKVKRIYRIFAELFPRKFNYSLELEKSKDSFSSIHYGALKGHSIINEVVRFSLYSDKIIVFHPLQNPAITNSNLNPGRNPKLWLPDFLEALYFYIVLHKWVKAGIVKLIVNPYEYDFDIRKKIDAEAIKRVSALYDLPEFAELTLRRSTGYMAEQFATGMKNKSKEQIIELLLAMNTPIFTVDEAETLAVEILNVKEITNPLYKKLPISFKNSETINTIRGGGGPLESILLISELTQGNIYTPAEEHWFQIRKAGLNDFWTKANHLYSEVPLSFLDSVDTNFALRIRQEERLSGVRQQLKKIYTELGGMDVDKMSETKIKFIQEGFVDEVRKAEAEWKEIERQASIDRHYWAVTSAVAAAPIIAQGTASIISLAVASATTAAWVYKSFSSVKEKNKLQRIKNPVSVFVEAKNKNQGYFSALKNCIF